MQNPKWEAQDAEGERGQRTKQRAEGAMRNEQSTGGRMRRLSAGEGSCRGVGQRPAVLFVRRSRPKKRATFARPQARGRAESDA